MQSITHDQNIISGKKIQFYMIGTDRNYVT